MKFLCNIDVEFEFEMKQFLKKTISSVFKLLEGSVRLIVTVMLTLEVYISFS